MLTDGRRFVLDAAKAGLRGWWFRAKAVDGSCVVHGNLREESRRRAKAAQFDEYVIKPFDTHTLDELLSRRAR